MIIARVLAALVLAIGLSAVPLSIARACSCMDPGGPAEIIEAAELAFIGTVVNGGRRGDGPFGPGAPMVRYAFDVERASAPISSDVVHVEALDDGGGASCGFYVRRRRALVRECGRGARRRLTDHRGCATETCAWTSSALTARTRCWRFCPLSRSRARRAQSQVSPCRARWSSGGSGACPHRRLIHRLPSRPPRPAGGELGECAADEAGEQDQRERRDDAAYP